MYEYKCAKCKKTFDVLQKFSDAPIKKHEGCGGKVEKLLSAPAFQFKGSGWYVTDYGKGGIKPGAHAEGGEGGKEGHSESKKEEEGSAKTATEIAASETKSDARSDTKSSDTKSSDTKSETNSAATNGESKSSKSESASSSESRSSGSKKAAGKPTETASKSASKKK